MAEPTNPVSYSSSFDAVLAHELGCIQERRKAVLQDQSDRTTPEKPDENAPAGTTDTESWTDQLRREALNRDLCGLALSGGGIRSATFNLGILQALAELGMLKRLDYLSSVSGGGYIHAWLAAWIRRESHGGYANLFGAVREEERINAGVKAPGQNCSAIENVSRQLTMNRVAQSEAQRDGLERTIVRDDEPAPIRHLRQYSRYLAPHGGLLSLDAWTLGSLYFRNLLANAVLFVLAVMALAAMCRLAVYACAMPRPDLVERFELQTHPEPVYGEREWGEYLMWAVLAAALLCMAVAEWCYRDALAILRVKSRFRQRGSFSGTEDPGTPRQMAANTWRKNFFGIAVTATGMCLAATWLLGPINDTGVSRMPETFRLPEVKAGGPSPYWVYAVAIGALGFAAGGVALIREWQHGKSTGFVGRWWIVVLSLLAALLIGAWLGVGARAFKGFFSDAELLRNVLLGIGVFAVIIFAVSHAANSLTEDALPLARVLNVLVGSAIFGVLFGLLVGAISNNLRDACAPYGAVGQAVLGVPLLLAALSVCGFLESIVCGRFLSEQEREWRTRVAAMLGCVAAVWLAVFATTLILPALLFGGGATVAAPAAGVWTLSAILSRFKAPADAVKSITASARLTRIVFTVAPYVFVAGLVALASALAVCILDYPHITFNLAREQSPDGLGVRAGAVAVWMAVFALGTGVYFFILDPNLFSLHTVYGNRLIRAYLAASRRMQGWNIPPGRQGPGEPATGVPTNVLDTERRADAFTGFHAQDDFSLLWFSTDPARYPDAKGFIFEPWKNTPTAYHGPYPIFNCTLNLVGGADLACQDRKGESFFLTPDYSGGDSTGYALFTLPKGNAAQARNLSLGRAMTISGAAVDPNMRNYQTGGLTALLTLLNLRLGWWLRNPWMSCPKAHGAERDAQWSARPASSAWHVVRELAGDTRADSPFVHLSDGGHFENTGAYELIRRRCRFVVMIDAAEDPADASENLANLVRLVRTDFGIRMEIDTQPLRKDADKLSAAHAAVGVIRYDDVDHGSVNGTFVFIRSSMTGDEPPDLRHYAANNPDFPHHGTVDQFFDEDQFESYRMLGQHIGLAVLGPAVREADRRDAERRKQESCDHEDPRYLRHLFADLRSRHAVVPASLKEEYGASVEDWLTLEESLADPLLEKLNASLYPEKNPADASGVAELRAMNRLLQMMETAWMQMNLDATHTLPMQRGWLNCFRRYAAAESFRQYWPLMRPQFHSGFVRFCEGVLSATPPRVTLDLCDPYSSDPQWYLMLKEFQGEWGQLAAAKGKTAVVAPDGRPAVMTDPWTWGGTPQVWQISYKDRPAAQTPFPLGFLALGKPRDFEIGSRTEVVSEVLLWIRGAFRATDVGSQAMKEFEAILKSDLVNELKRNADGRNVKALIVRYPKVGGTPAESSRRAQWTTFFNDFDFAALRLDRESARREVCLRRPL